MRARRPPHLELDCQEKLLTIPPSDSSIGRKLIEVMLRRPGWMLVAAILLTGLAIWPSQRLSFDNSIESLYAENDPWLREYRQSKAWFGGDDIVFVAYTDPELMSDDGLERVAQLTEQISQLPGVVPGSVQSLSQLLRIGRNPLMRRRHERLLDFGRGAVLGDDNQTTSIVLRLETERPAGTSREGTIVALRHLAAEQSLPTYVVGEPILVRDMFRYAQDDGAWMGWTASALLTVVILIFLRDLRAILLPFVIVQITIVWTKGVLATSQMQLTMVSSILGSLVTIIGVSTVVYTSLYYRSLRESLDRETAVRRMVQVLGMDIVWVCLTTAIGFSAQLTSHIHPVRSFGVTMVIGSVFVLAAMFLILPGGLLLGPERSHALRPRGDAQVNRSLLNVTEWVLGHRRFVWCVAGLVLLLSLAGLLRLRIETDFSKNFRASSPVVQSLDFFERRLGGTGAWEVNFEAPAELNEEFLEQVRSLAGRLRELRVDDQPALTKVLAATDGLDLVPRLPLAIPNLAAQQEKLNDLLPEFLPSLHNSDSGRMRILLRARERQSSEDKQQLIDAVTAAARREFPEARITGLFVLLTHLIDSLLHDQWIELLVAAAGLMAMMMLAYRSVWLGAVSLVPNVLPMILLLGGMGWFGLPVNIGTAMISADAMGLTIHDSIFYLSAYRRARLSGLDFRGALREVQTEVRRPLVYSNVALILGFLVLTTSHFVPLIYFGLLVSVAIAGGLLINLLLLPLLLEWFDGEEPVTADVTDGTDQK